VEPDSVLVDRVKQGDADAYEELVSRYERLARVVALRIVGDHHGAEDVVQDALVLAYRRLGSLRDGSKFGPWLMRIAKREAVRAARRRPATTSIESTGEPVEPARMEPLGDGQARLVELVNRLPMHERLVFTLFHLDGRPAGEIAAMTGRPVGTVTKQLSRAMKRLRRWAHKQEVS